MEWKPPWMVPSQATTFGRCVVHTSLLCTSLTPTPPLMKRMINHVRIDHGSPYLFYLSLSTWMPWDDPLESHCIWCFTEVTPMSYVTDISLGPTLSSIEVLRNVNPINKQCPVINGYWWQTGNRKSDHALGINRNKRLRAWYDQDVGLLKQPRRMTRCHWHVTNQEVALPYLNTMPMQNQIAQSPVFLLIMHVCQRSVLWT